MAALQDGRRSDETGGATRTYSHAVANSYAVLSEAEEDDVPPDKADGSGTERLVSASSSLGRSSTIVASGQLEGVECVDMLIDTGASCSFVRRSWAASSGLPVIARDSSMTVTLADRSTTVCTHEVRVSSMRVHGSEAECTLLVMDELSNEVIVGMSWQRAARLTIAPGYPHDLLNGQPVANIKRSTTGVVAAEVRRPSKCRVRLAAILTHVHAAAWTERGSESLRAAIASVDTVSTSNSQLRQVLQRYRQVFTEVLPVKTAEQIARAKQFSIVLIADEVRPVKQRERRGCRPQR